MAFSWLAVRCPDRREALRLTTAGPVSTTVQTGVRENNFAPVRDFVPDRPRNVRRANTTRPLLFGALTRPITGNASKDRLLARESY